MPIECNIFLNGGDIIRQDSIEAGNVQPFYFRPEELGSIILACCHVKDHGGSIYILDQKQFDAAINENGNCQVEKLEQYDHIIIPPGHTIPLTVRLDEDSTTFVFSHYSPN